MTQDDIIRMALEAGFNDYFTDELVAALERFAALVAEATKEKAAKVCEEEAYTWRVKLNAEDEAHGAERCAAAIRSMK